MGIHPNPHECRNGHVRTEQNTIQKFDKQAGKYYSFCLDCKKLVDEKYCLGCLILELEGGATKLGFGLSSRA